MCLHGRVDCSFTPHSCSHALDPHKPMRQYLSTSHTLKTCFCPVSDYVMNVIDTLQPPLHLSSLTILLSFLLLVDTALLNDLEGRSSVSDSRAL